WLYGPHSGRKRVTRAGFEQVVAQAANGPRVERMLASDSDVPRRWSIEQLAPESLGRYLRRDVRLRITRVRSFVGCNPPGELAQHRQWWHGQRGRLGWRTGRGWARP